LFVIGAGKASAAMARTGEDNVHGPLEGLVATSYGEAVPCERIEIVKAPMIIYLCFDKAEFVTSANIAINGRQHMTDRLRKGAYDGECR
jgi:hypothetical protein